MKTKSMSRILRQFAAPLTALVLIGGATIVLGRWTHRWDDASGLEHAAAAMKNLPDSFGSWTLLEDLSKSEEELAVAEASGCLFRRYRNRDTKEVVTVLMLCGRPGPISVHPPTACYRARGYRMSRGPMPASINSHGFRLAEFQNPASIAEDRVAILWGWSHDGDWSAPVNPRVEFAGQPFLNKLYVTWSRNRDERPLEESVPLGFLAEFMPVARNAFPIEN
jgi:hypothetical protein